MAYEDLSEVLSASSPSSPYAISSNIFIQLIGHAIRNLKIKPDKQTAARIKEFSLDTEEIRKLRLQEADSSRRKVSVQLQLLETNYQETVGGHDPCEHSTEMEKLVSEELKIAKEASEIEEENYQLEKQLQDLRKELSELESQGVEGDESTRQSRENEDPLLWVIKSQ